MNDAYDFNNDYEKPSRWQTIPVAMRAALLYSIPFIVVDAFNYFSAGTMQAFSWPVMGLLYAACGVTAARFAADGGAASSDFPLTGAKAGLALWLVSTLVNVIISLIAGLASLGTTLILGVPYLCLCAPVQLIAGGLVGALGGWGYGRFSGRGQDTYL